jgi:alpha-L-fucosidase
VPANNLAFARRWLLRANDLVDQYRPDLVYYDDTGLPLGEFGLAATAHYYNRSLEWQGKLDVLTTCKELSDVQRRAVVEDVERGFSDRLRAEPWQTDTCIGEWHYSRPLYENRGYKTARQVIQRLADVVSKNGCLLLSIPVRSDGTIDELEQAILSDMAGWMAINGEAIFASRPWRTYGEGPTELKPGKFSEGGFRGFVAEDIRFTVKDGKLYTLGMEWPAGDTLSIRSLGKRAGTIQRIELLGGGALEFAQGEQGVSITLPATRPTFTPVFRIGMTGV